MPTDHAMQGNWPTEIRLRKDRSQLIVSFENGERFDLPAEYLRVESPSAEVQGHHPEERQLVAGKRDVQIVEIHPVGNYAVRLVFDDMHSTGIFSWDYLHRLGHEQEERFARYLAGLKEKGMSREPPKRR